MRKILFHLVSYSLVAGGCFWAGALYRDYRVKHERQEARARVTRLLDQAAPEIQATTLEGKPWKLSDQRGKVVVLEAWATWCGPCVAQLPASKRLYEKFKHEPEFQFFGASLDSDAQKVRDFCVTNTVPWTQLLEPGRVFDSSVARAFGVTAIPFTCVIDKKGFVRRLDGWASPDSSGPIDVLIERLLKEPNQPSELAARNGRGSAGTLGKESDER
jgi:peroxiredoxin